MTPDRRFPARYRVRSRRDFDRIYAQRLRVADGVLAVHAATNGLAHPRLGLAVGRRVGGAVVRNRWKRRLREAFRLCREQLPGGVDLVVSPLAHDEPPFESLQNSLAGLAARAAKKLAERGDGSGSKGQGGMSQRHPHRSTPPRQDAP